MIRLDEWIRKGVTIILKSIHKEDQEELINTLIQFVKFGLVGVSNTLISYGINILTLKLLEPSSISWDYIIANGVAFVLSVLWSFYWNNKYVFTSEEKRSAFLTLLKTYAAYGFTGIILTNILSYVWIDLLWISKYIAPILNLIISIPINFLINKKWAFK